ncbi:MAG: response regulator transcription factor [Phycisphaerales bacterium]
MRLLVVEDSSRLRQTLEDGLRSAGYAVDACGDGRNGLIHARTTDYDLIVLDLMLPELDGLSLLRQVRAERCVVPVLILSAQDRVERRVEALRAGADDFLIKPFAFDELLARVEALCRRSRGAASNVIRVGEVELDLAAKRFATSRGEIALAPREYAVLEYLVLNAGRTVSRAELEEHVYGEDRQVWSNSVDSAIASIRRRLQEAGVREFVRTRRGRGYLVLAAGDS